MPTFLRCRGRFRSCFLKTSARLLYIRVNELQLILSSCISLCITRYDCMLLCLLICAKYVLSAIDFTFVTEFGFLSWQEQKLKIIFRYWVCFRGASDVSWLKSVSQRKEKMVKLLLSHNLLGFCRLHFINNMKKVLYCDAFPKKDSCYRLFEFQWANLSYRMYIEMVWI